MYHLPDSECSLLEIIPLKHSFLILWSSKSARNEALRVLTREVFDLSPAFWVERYIKRRGIKSCKEVFWSKSATEPSVILNLENTEIIMKSKQKTSIHWFFLLLSNRHKWKKAFVKERNAFARNWTRVHLKLFSQKGFHADAFPTAPWEQRSSASRKRFYVLSSLW